MQVGSTMAVATPVGTPAPAAASSAALALTALLAGGYAAIGRRLADASTGGSNALISTI